jgi:arylformamidase
MTQLFNPSATMNPKATFYLSYSLSSRTPLFGNGRGIKLVDDKQQRSGDSCNTMNWAFPDHAGTHIDAPLHFSINGKSISDYPAEFWFFNSVEIVDISEHVCDAQLIEPDIFPNFVNQSPDLVLLKTGYGKRRESDSYTISPPGVSENVAYWIRDHYPNVRVVGMDLISVSSFAIRSAGKTGSSGFFES